jgi:Ca-activated chloride channel family protein
MMRVAASTALALMLSSVLYAQAPLTLKFVSPTDAAYVSGGMLLKVVIEGQAAPSLIEDVTFFADGKQVCVAPGTSPQCDWDAGPDLKSHALRAVARLKAGGRLVATVRTKAVEYAEAVSVDAVLVNAVVTDGGRFVQGLTRDAFRVLDDGRERPITSFQSTDAPLELVLALDVSDSMQDALPEVKAAAGAFLSALRPQDRVTLVAFNDAMFTLARNESSRDTLLNAVNDIHASGGTALFDVIVKSLQTLSRQPGKHAIVVFTDGDDRSSQATLAQVRRLVEDSDAMLFAIGLGRAAQQDASRQILELLAEVSGGRALFAERSDKLTESFAEVVRDLANQYTLGFEPQRDGRSHEIKIQVPKQRYRIRARRSYTGPQAVQ